jgi:hypothetical protein
MGLAQSRPVQASNGSVQAHYALILLQKSKVAAPQIFRENKKREPITDSYTLNHVAVVAGEFDSRGPVPSRLYTNARQRPAEFLITCAKRLLQRYLPVRDITGLRRFKTSFPVQGLG